MDTPEQFSNEDPDEKNVLLHVSDVILGVVIPGCAVLTLALIFLIWFKSDCLEPQRPTDDGDHDEVPLQDVKSSGAPERKQDHCPPAYEPAGSYAGSTMECRADVRTIGPDEFGGTPSQ